MAAIKEWCAVSAEREQAMRQCLTPFEQGKHWNEFPGKACKFSMIYREVDFDGYRLYYRLPYTIVAFTPVA